MMCSLLLFQMLSEKHKIYVVQNQGSIVDLLIIFRIKGKVCC